MWLSDTSIKQPVLITMVLVALLVFGGISYSRMAVDLFPDVAFPIVAVTTSYPGAGPEEVETQVTKPLEEVLGAISGLESMRSVSSESVSAVVLEFKLGYPVDRAATDVRDRVAATKALLPSDAQAPVIQRFDPGVQPVLTAAVAPKDHALSSYEVRKLAEDRLKPRLEQLEGVAAVGVLGGQEREIQVELSLDALRARNLSPQQVLTALRVENVNVPGGRMVEGNQDVLLRTTGQFERVEDLGQVVVATSRSGVPIYLRDVAALSDGFKEVRSFTRLNGSDAVLLTITKESGSNTVQVSRKVKAELQTLEQEVGGLVLSPVRDESLFVQDSLNDLIRALLLGALAATLVVFVFFGDLRNTLVTVAGLPVIVIGTFAVIGVLGYSINMVTMMALTLSIGLLIDDAIVVRENIFRHMESGEEPRIAASRGTGEIAFAVLAMTFSIVSVFLPVAFATGIIGMFMRQFGITVAVAVFISLFEAFTLAPMLSAYFFRRIEKAGELRENGRKPAAALGRLFEGVRAGYGRLLGWSLAHRRIVIAAAVGVTIGGLALVPFIGTTFIQPSDQGLFTMSLELPAGTTLEESDILARSIEKTTLEQPGVDSVLSTVGGEGTPELTSFFVRIRPGAKSLLVMDRLRKVFGNLPQLQFSTQPVAAGGGAATNLVMGRPFQLSVSGDISLEELDTISSRVLETVRSVPGIIEADRSVRAGKPELRLAVDRAHAADLGLNAAVLGSSVRTLMNGEVPSTLRQGDTETDIRVRLRSEDRQRLQDVLALTIPIPKGGAVPLSSVINLQQTTGPRQVQRMDRQRQVIIGADYKGRPLGDILRDVTRAVGDLHLPSSVQTRFLGQAQNTQETFASLTLALALGVVFVYMVLASQFGSFLHPFTIMFSLPLSFGGAFLALMLAGKPLDMMAMIGIIMLMGLVTKNAILLIDFILRLRRNGYTREQAILAAGPTRLRPILMTTAAMIFGMTPSALAVGAGSEFRAPMAITVIGGLITSTMLTLVVVPVVYTLLDDAQNFFSRRKRVTQEAELVAALAGESVPLERLGE